MGDEKFAEEDGRLRAACRILAFVGKISTDDWALLTEHSLPTEYFPVTNDN